MPCSSTVGTRRGADTVHLAVADGEGTAGVGPADDPVVRIAADPDTFLELSAGAITPATAAARGATIDGAPDAIERMGAVLPARR